jgi:hypothetical protein
MGKEENRERQGNKERQKRGDTGIRDREGCKNGE